jgi:para-aminobenzoate synthetase component I
MISPLAPWYWRSHPLNRRSGAEIFAALFRRDAIATLLESPTTHGIADSDLARFSLCAGRPRTVAGHPQLWTPSLGTIFPWLTEQTHRPQSTHDSTHDSPQPPAELPFHGGWLGWLGYDAGWEIEELPWRRVDPLPFPVAYWYEPDCFAVLDHQTQQLWLAASNPRDLDRLSMALENPTPALIEPHHPEAFQTLTFGIEREEFQAKVRQAKRYIQAGDIFQTNLSLRFQTQGTADPWAIYLHLHRINPSPFASYWQTPWGGIISGSPERLVQLSDRLAQTRPIAGTRPRGSTPEQDQALAAELLTHPKELAEHIMLVDLERNDLGRVCTWGTVQVDELTTIERYSHVMHLVSNVQGTLAPEQSSIDLIKAVFPGGTITGCPKVRCMEIIEELEPVRRSLFYGSCGYLDVRGHLDLNILIRTLLFAPSSGGDRPELTLWGQVGAGIVADSDPDLEWQESLQKSKAQVLALQTLTS